MTARQRPVSENKFHAGNGDDGKHYWLTPPALFEELNREFSFDHDPCPFPKPDDYDGLTAEWGASNYVNPPFGSVMHNGKKKGMTAWIRKAIAEHQKGKRVVVVFPMDKWVLMALAAGAKIRNLGDVKWLSTEDRSPGRGTGRHIACFVFDKNSKGEKPKMSMMQQLEKLVDVAIEALVEVRTYYSRLNGQELPLVDRTRVEPLAVAEPVPVAEKKERKPRAKKEAPAPLEPAPAPASPFGLGGGASENGGRKPEPPDALEDAGPRCRELMGLFVRKNLNATPPGYQQLQTVLKETLKRDVTAMDQLTPEDFAVLLPVFEKKMAAAA